MKNIYYTIIGILRIIKKGNYFSRKQFVPISSNKVLRILGNGKSLNDVSLIEDDAIDYMVVNRHVLGDNYTTIRPAYYVLADPHFFRHPEGLNVIKTINEKTTWSMTLCVVYTKEAKQALKQIVDNSNIKIIFYNQTAFEGYNNLRYYFYDQQLAMPVVQNVLVASIMIGLQMNYMHIELYGVEHSWTKYLFVGENNVVYLENPHFFDKGKVSAQPVKDIQHTNEYPIYLILKNYSRMFKSYWEIKNYMIATRKSNHICNKTKGSFIDAFKREKL